MPEAQNALINTPESLNEIVGYLAIAIMIWFLVTASGNMLSRKPILNPKTGEPVMWRIIGRWPIWLVIGGGICFLYTYYDRIQVMLSQF